MNKEFVESYSQILDSIKLAGTELVQFMPLNSHRCLGIQKFEEKTTLFIYDINIAGAPIYAIKPEFGDFGNEKDVLNAVIVLEEAARAMARKYGRTPYLTYPVVGDDNQLLKAEHDSDIRGIGIIQSEVSQLMNRFRESLSFHNNHYPFVGKLGKFCGAEISCVAKYNGNEIVIEFPKDNAGNNVTLRYQEYCVSLSSSNDKAPNPDVLVSNLRTILAATTAVYPPIRWADRLHVLKGQ